MGKRITYIRLAALLLFIAAVCWLSLPQEVKAVTAEENGQTVITESTIEKRERDFLVGRYQINYTGNVNYYRIMDSVEEASNPGTGTNKATAARKQAAAKALGLGAKAEKITTAPMPRSKRGAARMDGGKGVSGLGDAIKEGRDGCCRAGKTRRYGKKGKGNLRGERCTGLL